MIRSSPSRNPTTCFSASRGGRSGWYPPNFLLGASASVATQSSLSGDGCVAEGLDCVATLAEARWKTESDGLANEGDRSNQPERLFALAATGGGILSARFYPRKHRGAGRGFPTDLPMVGSEVADGKSSMTVVSPTDLPMVGFDSPAVVVLSAVVSPTDLPMVGSGTRGWGWHCTVVSPTDLPMVGWEAGDTR